MSIFLGMTFYMGILQLPRFRDYWRTDRLYNFRIRKFMSRDRYLIILRCLHFAENPRAGGAAPSDRLYKVRPLLDFFNKKMSIIYSPGKNLSIDESMLLWRGRLLFRQYIKNKKHKYGIKFYLLTECDGTILKIQIYCGVFDDLGGKGHAANVVLNLLDNYCNNGYSVYMDNFYNSVSLARQLLENKIFCTGTLRAGRKDTPKEIFQIAQFRTRPVGRNHQLNIFHQNVKQGVKIIEDSGRGVAAVQNVVFAKMPCTFVNRVQIYQDYV
ncbi:unnamed protein product [Acanthoscelides obtectus]|uniref:PiggyBac transposable element-derived protein domain-containing protein n=1 Tax=Acanthoscelides obtectus TaxID=200917 RepID=A0A9P0LF99_ACAOB|nr:unnamed protein product [Acanthoscelides obtectus]CAH2003168.1 unnamed protein product [Acanthoscelides obtectus]CAK1632231.1 PiggyBac transposable element-derived protein 4 [Acanthoscelides obtectus]CAK1680548.1 PiggyBac transposable element-derived protein 4 [Acanthoscelides obtectus]